jgi:hypothetical protein
VDPNTNLAEMRELAAAILNDQSCPDPYEPSAAQAERLAELVQALDEWLTKGGFLPHDWRK